METPNIVNVKGNEEIVVLKLQTYHDLQVVIEDLQRQVKRGFDKTVFSGFYGSSKIMTSDEAVEKIAKEMRDIEKNKISLQKEIDDFKYSFWYKMYKRFN